MDDTSVIEHTARNRGHKGRRPRPALQPSGWHDGRSGQAGKKNPLRQGEGTQVKKKKEPAAAYFPPVWSIIGAGGLDFRVRNGNGYCPSAMATGTTITIHAGEAPGDTARGEAL